MNSSRIKKRLLFFAVAIIFIMISGFPYFKNYIANSTPYTVSASNFLSSILKIQDLKQSNLENTASNHADEKNRITNDKCGISFVVPEEWVITSVSEGERYCDYRIKNPFKRGAILTIGIPPVSINTTSHLKNRVVIWDNVFAELSSTQSTYSATTVAGAEGFLFKFSPPPSNGDLYGDPIYLFKKKMAVYYIRYGYYPTEENMLEDISSVLSSFRFIRESSFYDTPMYGPPNN